MKLAVLSAAFYKNESLFASVKDSCERLGLPLVTYGIGQKFPGFYQAKIVSLLDALRKVDAEHILFCDARDSVVLRDEDAILKAYKRICKTTGGKIAFCADRKSFPYPELSEAFTKIGKGRVASECNWKGKKTRRVFLNAGVFMAETEYLRKCLTRLMKMYDNESGRVEHPQDDQGWWSMAVARGLVEVAIDYKCELAAMTTYTPDEWYSLSDGKCAFRPTHTEPCVLHFAGLKDTNKRMPRFLEGMGFNG